MLKNSLVALSLILTLPALAVGQEKKNGPSSKGSINWFPNCSQVPGNLIQNCGFETGSFEGWFQSGDTSFTSVTREARHSGEWGASIGPERFPGFLFQVVPTIPGQLYNLSFWMRSAGRPNQFMLFWDGMPISNSTNFPTTATPLGDVADPQFDQMFFGALPATTDSTLISFGFFNRADLFFFDDVVLLPSTSGAQPSLGP